MRRADRHFALMTILKRMATIGVMTEAVKRRPGCDHFFCCRSTRARKSPAPTDVCCDGVATRRSGRPIADARALADHVASYPAAAK
jgi:hypothetical protein